MASEGAPLLQSYDGDVLNAAAESGLNPHEILDFSSSITPAPVTDAVRSAILQAADALGCYPDPDARRLRERAATIFGVKLDEVLAGGGVTEFLYAIPRALRSRRTVLMAPCCQEYWRAAELGGAEVTGMLTVEANEFVPDMGQLELHLSGCDMVFWGNPNNPTGVVVPADSVRALAARFPQVVFVMDESFVEFVPQDIGATMLAGGVPANVIVLRSLSPFHALPGIRLGFLAASQSLCAQVERVREPRRVSVLALVAGEALLADVPDIAAIRGAVIAERERIREELSRITGVRVFRSQANFLLLKITRPSLTSGKLCERMLKQKVLIRNAAVFRGLDGRYVRITIRTPAENDVLLTTLRASLEEARWK